MSAATKELVECVQYFASQNWVPATSSNFSVRLDGNQFAMSISGRDKNRFSEQDLMIVDQDLNSVDGSQHLKPSAESLIHMYLYEGTDAKSVMHTHSINSTVLSKRFLPQGEIRFEGLEILKCFRGVRTHEHCEVFPIVENSQDMNVIIRGLKGRVNSLADIHGFLIAGHGLYTWGQSVAEARRHLEGMEFLFASLISELSMQ